MSGKFSQSTLLWQVLQKSLFWTLFGQEQSQKITSKPLKTSAEPTPFSISATTNVSCSTTKKNNDTSGKLSVKWLPREIYFGRQNVLKSVKENVGIIKGVELGAK